MGRLLRLIEVAVEAVAVVLMYRGHRLMAATAEAVSLLFDIKYKVLVWDIMQK
jgi:hypothetical protein